MGLAGLLAKGGSRSMPKSGKNPIQARVEEKFITEEP